MSTANGSEPFFVPRETQRLFERKESILEIWEVYPGLQSHGARFRRMIKKELRGVRLKKLRKLGDVTCWQVDGERVRLIDDDFNMGGHGARYLFIPLDEIWIDVAYKNWNTLFVHEYAEYRRMCRRKNYNDAHDIASKMEITIRHGDFVLPVSHFAQEKNHTCGPAALRIVLDYLGRRTTERQLAKLCESAPKHGTNPRDLVAAARSLGYRVIWREHWTSARVIRTLEQGLPVIANHQQRPGLGEGHYAVIIGHTKRGEFVLSDPSCDDRFRVIPIRRFMDLWYELEDDTVREGIAVY